MRRRLALCLVLTGVSLGSSVSSRAFAQTGAPPPPATVAPPAPLVPVSDAPLPPAPPQPPPSLPPAPPPMIDPQIAAWEARYVAARQALTQGRFDEAARAFENIARRAPDPIMRAHAAELGGIGRYWATQGMVLGPSAMFDAWTRTQEETNAKPDKRSTDEIAVLYTNTVLWGMSFGITTGVASEGSAAAFFVPGLGMAGAGVTAVALMDNLGKRPLRYGVPHSITSGLYIGFEAGLFAGIAAGTLDHSNDVSAGAVAGIMWGSATAGAITGGIVGDYLGVTPGRAAFTGSGALWGGVVSSFVGAAGVAGSSGRKGDGVPWLSGLAGTAVGAVAGGLFAGGVSPSIARVRFIDLGGLVGGLTFGGIYASVASSTGDHDLDERAFLLTSSLGIVCGLGGTYFLTRGMDPDAPRRVRREESTALTSLTPTLTPTKDGFSGGVRGVF